MSKDKMSRYFQFFLVVLAAGAIFPLIYLKTNYQETMLEVFNMTLPQLNIIFSVLGIVFVLGYFPSGLLADKFSAKKLLTVSLFATGLGGLWFAQIPSYTNVIIIFCIWGTFSIFTFWSAHLKIVKLLAEKEEEGRFFGILDGGRGVVEAALASFALLIFSKVLGTSTDLALKREALVYVIYMYSFLLIIVSILVGIFVNPDKVMKKKEVETIDPAKADFKLSDVLKVFKNPSILTLGGIIFMGYIVTWTIYYFGGFLQTNIKIDPVTVSGIMVIVLWMRPVGGICGGFLADKFGKTHVLNISLILAGVLLVLISILPVTTNPYIFYALIGLCGIFIYTIRGTYWSLLGDCRVDDKILGASIGVVSFIGYVPDIFIPIVNTYLFTTFGDNGGYNAYFIWSAVMGAIGVGLIFLFKKLVKANA